jgi:PAS domain S-box-containing protein
MAQPGYSAASIFAAESETCALMRAFDWSSTRLGAPEAWPQSLRSLLSVCLNARFPACVFWGDEYLLLYNDAWSKILGGRHPQALCQPAREASPELWECFSARLEQALRENRASWEGDETTPASRCDRSSERNLEFNFSPIQGEGGAIVGVFASATEAGRLPDDEPRGDRPYGLADGATSVESACSERHEPQQQVGARQQAILEFALNRVHDAVYLINEDARILYGNDETSRALGYSPEELQSLRVADIDPDFPLTRWPTHWHELKDRGSLAFETCHRTKDGRLFPVEVTANYFEYGGRAYNLALVRDISERKRVEQERLLHLHSVESMDRLNRVIQGVNDLEQMMSDALDAVLSIFDCDRAYLMYPCDPDAAFWWVPMERTKPQYPGALQLGLKIPMDVGVARAQQTLLAHDGPLRFGPGMEHGLPADSAEQFGFKSFMSMAIHPKVGKPWHFGIHQCSYARIWTHDEAILLQEIGRRLADGLTSLLSYRNLQESEAKYRRIVDTANEGIWVLGPDNLTLFVNAQMAEMLGYSEDEMKDHPATDFMFKEDVADHLGRMENRRGGVREHYECRLCRKDGQAVWMLVSATPVFDAKGHIEGAFAMFTDITERKNAEEALRTHKEHLEETVQKRTAELIAARDATEAARVANRAKSVFLANMSHQLRTPLNAILGFSAMLLKDPQVMKEQRQSLEIISRSGDHLLKLINDVLEFTKIEAGHMMLNIAPFDLGAMVREVTDVTRLRAMEIGLRLEVEQSPEVPRYIKADEGRLRQILANLADNAVKFTKQGTITIRLCIRQNAQPHLQMEVEDTGPGIAPDDLKSLFKPFAQLGGVGTTHLGAGLGLVLSRQFAQTMGGTLSATSTPGKGTVFRVDIPVELAEGVDIGAEERPVVAGEVVGSALGTPRYRILIAEDQAENQLLLRQLMTKIGLRVKVAANGEECVKLFRAWRPHLIWMDRRMPVMDGIEAAHCIRNLPEGRDVKIVAVTASVFKEQQQEMLNAGMDDLVCKPYRFDEIYGCLAKQLGVKYIYSTDTAKAVSVPVKLTPEMLADLPAALCKELKEAVESLDSARIEEVIQQVSKNDEALGQILMQLAVSFEYPAILQVLAAESAVRPRY